MKTATLTINGKTYEVQLTDEQVIEIEEPKKVTGFEKAETDSCYFCENSRGYKEFFGEHGMKYDNDRYETANYYTDESLAEWCIRNDTLNRKMRRWAAEHNKKPIDWTNELPYKYHLYYNYDTETVEITDNRLSCYMASCYFNTIQIAKAAVEKFGEEIKWLAENRPKWF